MSGLYSNFVTQLWDLGQVTYPIHSLPSLNFPTYEIIASILW